MKATKQIYMVSFEVLNAILIAIGLFMIFCFLGYFVYFIKPIFISLQDISQGTILPTIAAEFYWLASLLFFGFFSSFLIFMVGFFQYLIIALPISHFMSSSLENDAKRSWAFYVLSGALIGGGPWWILGYFMFDSRTDMGSLLAVLAPGLTIWLLAGAILKRRLIKLAAATSIENSIK
jgi:hypothetical protein